ncbi:hypothetical protein SAMN05421743_105212 [Thalassobacillus cyri]|uniref:Uncharacterized protein n=1 Tax=Thalassobacillus cyri TaxID=571932 RepID=A0A1H4C026_9BACI|nr:hypothetical protein [Thalassobacillus cyri]SEA53673.1 hypothetical protein SAMN05421743_105212 [Thalassobacillus cyri]
MGEEANVLHLPVRLTTDDSPEVNMEKINRLALEPLKEEDIFAFSGNCSNDRLDSYFTRMDPVTTLRNYAEDLKNGVSLQEGHNIFTNPYGRSYDGVLVPATDNGDDFNSVRGSWYIIRDITLNGNQTNDTIRAIKGGVIRDMSVGFGGQKMWYQCGSCGKDLFDWECPHIPGLEDEEGRISFAWVADARLREVSTVYKGSTPGAYIDKARQYVDQKELPEDKIVKLEQRFQTRFERGDTTIFMPKREENQTMNLLEQIRQALSKGELEKRAVYEVLSGEGEVFRQPEDVQLRNELGDAATVEGIKQLKREAEQGRQYFVDTVDEAVKARVRAHGDAFNEDNYRQMLTCSADLNYIKEEIETYNRLAKDSLTPGRQTERDDPGRHEEADDVVVSETFKGEDK